MMKLDHLTKELETLKKNQDQSSFDEEYAEEPPTDPRSSAYPAGSNGGQWGPPQDMSGCPWQWGPPQFQGPQGPFPGNPWQWTGPQNQMEAGPAGYFGPGPDNWEEQPEEIPESSTRPQRAAAFDEAGELAWLAGECVERDTEISVNVADFLPNETDNTKQDAVITTVQDTNG